MTTNVKIWAEHTHMAGRVCMEADYEGDDIITLDRETAEVWAACTDASPHGAYLRRAGTAALAWFDDTKNP